MMDICPGVDCWVVWQLYFQSFSLSIFKIDSNTYLIEKYENEVTECMQRSPLRIEKYSFFFLILKINDLFINYSLYFVKRTYLESLIALCYFSCSKYPYIFHNFETKMVPELTQMLQPENRKIVSQMSLELSSGCHPVTKWDEVLIFL